MSKAGVMQVIDKSLTDAAWRAQYKANADAALSGFDLTPVEAAALKKQDANKLKELGITVDERVQKALSTN